MEELIPLFIILFLGLLFSEFFKRLHLPYVTALIIAGIVFGPGALGLLRVDATIEFIGSIGLVFLMFIAGTEIKFKNLRNEIKNDLIVVSINSLIPFLLGVFVMWWFGYDWPAAIVLGITFISSSIAVIIPTLAANNLSATPLGKLITSSTVIQDIASLLMISLVLQYGNESRTLPLPAYILLLLVMMAALRFIIPRLQSWYRKITTEQDFFEYELRFIILILLSVVVLFELLDVDGIVAAFIVGMLVGDNINPGVESKIRTIAYGLFIPVFFVVLGANLNLGVFNQGTSIVITLAIVSALILSKSVSGFISGKILKLSNEQSVLLGVATIPQMSTTLAAVFTASELGILDDKITAAMIILSIVTTIIAPMLVSAIASSPKIKQIDVEKL